MILLEWDFWHNLKSLTRPCGWRESVGKYRGLKCINKLKDLFQQWSIVVDKVNLLELPWCIKSNFNQLTSTVLKYSNSKYKIWPLTQSVSIPDLIGDKEEVHRAVLVFLGVALLKIFQALRFGNFLNVIFQQKLSDSVLLSLNASSKIWRIENLKKLQFTSFQLPKSFILKNSLTKANVQLFFLHTSLSPVTTNGTGNRFTFDFNNYMLSQLSFHVVAVNPLEVVPFSHQSPTHASERKTYSPQRRGREGKARKMKKKKKN